jgi:hypothetical protein
MEKLSSRHLDLVGLPRVILVSEAFQSLAWSIILFLESWMLVEDIIIELYFVNKVSIACENHKSSSDFDKDLTIIKER